MGRLPPGNHHARNLSCSATKSQWDWFRNDYLPGLAAAARRAAAGQPADLVGGVQHRRRGVHRGLLHRGLPARSCPTGRFTFWAPTSASAPWSRPRPACSAQRAMRLVPPDYRAASSRRPTTSTLWQATAGPDRHARLPPAQSDGTAARKAVRPRVPEECADLLQPSIEDNGARTTCGRRCGRADCWWRAWRRAWPICCAISSGSKPWLFRKPALDRSPSMTTTEQIARRRPVRRSGRRSGRRVAIPLDLHRRGAVDARRADRSPVGAGNRRRPEAASNNCSSPPTA